MIYQIIAITLKELKVLWLDREALALLFAMPMFFILVMSFALEGVFQAGSKGHPIEILAVHQNGGWLADQTIADLKRMEGLILTETYEGIPLTPDKAEQLIGKGVHSLALVFPEGLYRTGSKNIEGPPEGEGHRLSGQRSGDQPSTLGHRERSDPGSDRASGFISKNTPTAQRDLRDTRGDGGAA